MADAISLYLDISIPQGRLIKSLTDAGTFVLGPFYQGQLLKLRIYPVTVAGAIAPTITKVPLTNLDLQVAVGPRAGAEAIKAAQYIWNKQIAADTDGESGYFYADLDLNTTDLNTAVGTNDTLSTYFEFLLSRASAAFAPVHQTAVTILSVVKGPGSAASTPTPAAAYLTEAQCYNLFVLWDNRVRAQNNGRVPIFVSPDGSHTRECPGVDNDGSPTDNLT